MERTDKGKWICQYNPECECDIPECHKCGWNPEVAERRMKEFKESIMFEKKYKVSFTGYCEVWAKSAEEAADKAEDVNQQFFAHYDYSEPILAGEEDEDELD